LPETFESDVAILRRVLDEYRAEVAKGGRARALEPRT
jgi:hypothetical protein